MMNIKETVFREYDIRGTFGKDFNAELAYALGRVFGAWSFTNQWKEKTGRSTPLIGVGHDCRVSGPELTGELVRGLCDAGCDVLYTGMGPTPQVYFSVFTKNLDGGIQVTGSHNPADQNGFKMMLGKHTLSGADIVYLKENILKKNFSTPSKQGQVTTDEIRPEYIADLIERSKPRMGKKKLKIVVDAGNGVGMLVGAPLLRALGCELIEIFGVPDGRFPNHHPDPTVVENIQEMRKLVVELKADCGIAWDGDADRIGVVDENGTPIFGDMLLTIFGRELLKEVPGATIIGEVKCSEFMYEDLRKHGANAVMCATGHSKLKTKLRELNGSLAGEMSGHIFFAHRYFGFDDALHASARFVEILSNHDGATSTLLKGIPQSFSTPEIRVDCSDELKFLVAKKAQAAFPEYQTNTTDGVRITFDRGWGLVRASNTQPILVMRFEAESEALLTEYQNLVETRVSAIRDSLAAS
jgi:phosphomannomutase / phosphoglucomutase